jgi:hypothetical protein
MKYLILFFLATPAMAQSNYYANRFNGCMTQVYTASNNGYYYVNKEYKKPKQINRDLSTWNQPTGNVGNTVNINKYAPPDLRINR